MKINLKNLLLLVWCAFILNANAIDKYPKYVLASVSFYTNSLVLSSDFKFSGLYSSDSCYVKILSQSSPLLIEYSSAFQIIRPSQKINRQWQTNDSFQFIDVACFDDESLNSLQNAFVLKQYQGTVLYKRPISLSLRIKTNLNEISLLLANENVKFISFLPPHVQEINFVERSNHRVSQFAPNFPNASLLTGKGVSLGEWDGGDIGRHIDFDSRLTVVKKLGIDAHATPVGGTMAGAGNLEPEARGRARGGGGRRRGPA